MRYFLLTFLSLLLVAFIVMLFETYFDHKWSRDCRNLRYTHNLYDTSYVNHGPFKGECFYRDNYKDVWKPYLGE